MFRKDEAAREQWSEAHVRMCAGRQAQILDNAAAMLRPGGRMVYSTCTFAPEENEGSIAAFLGGTAGSAWRKWMGMKDLHGEMQDGPYMAVRSWRTGT